MIHFNYMVQNLPGITVIMIDSGRNDEWFEIAKQSVAGQMYPLKLIDAEKNEWQPQIELIVYPNRDKKLVIGECWNKMVRGAKYNYIFILDDDDKLRPMVLFDLMFYLQVLKSDKKNKDIIGVTPYITFMSHYEDQSYHKLTHNYTSGLIEKEWLLKIPFREDVKKHVDMRWDDDILKKGKYVAIQSWNLGYMYRQHDNMVSGQNMHMRYAAAGLNEVIDIETGIEWQDGENEIIASAIKFFVYGVDSIHQCSGASSLVNEFKKYNNSVTIFDSKKEMIDHVLEYGSQARHGVVKFNALSNTELGLLIDGVHNG